MTKVSSDSEMTRNVEKAIEEIPNGVHLHRIKKALSKGHAAVMVGSGFSLNAQGGNRLPVWSGLVDALLSDLHSNEEDKAEARKRLGGTSAMLRLTEEYAAVLGRAQLDARMHELLPDAGIVMPGDLHMKLLSLNWSDVYTTNYDTLLERAIDTDRREFIPQIKRRYQVVVAANDVPFSKSNGRPRVVKLHGSLRTGSSLIVTEEDYRSYPTVFAPFVSIVQQSMLENIFCLIGFSGDDPNFLLWTGWVRDRLGERTPPIYLITLKAVSEGERLILERRNIFPIDIASLGTLNGKVDYAASLVALLDFWRDQPPPSPADWPFHRPTDALRSPDVSVDDLISWTTLAQKNRTEYPGWLVAPAANRKRLGGVSSVWRVISAYRSLPGDTPRWFRLVLLSEILWILETTLAFPSTQLAQDIEALFHYKIQLEKSPPSPRLPEEAQRLRPNGTQLMHLESLLLIATLKTAREDADREAFQKWIKKLDDVAPLETRSSEIQCEALYQQILLFLEERRRDEAVSILKQLDAAINSNVDLYWSIRVGAIFGELDLVDRGHTLVRSGLHSIRESMQVEGESIYLVSREQWAERLFGAFDLAAKEAQNVERSSYRNRRAQHQDSSSDSKAQHPEVGLQEILNRERYHERGKSPTKLNFSSIRDTRDNAEHPISQIELVLQEIDIAKRVLDLAKVGIDSTSLSEIQFDSIIRGEAFGAAVTYIRLTERTALVPSVGLIGVSARNLATCYRILAATGHASAGLRVFFRANSGANQVSADALSLNAISALPSDIARDIFIRFSREIEWRLDTHRGQWEISAISGLKFALDLTSRIAFRLGASEAKRMADLAFSLYGNKEILQFASLHRTFCSFLSRTFRLLSSTEQAKLALQVFAIQPPDSAFERSNDWPDLPEILEELSVVPCRNEQWKNSVDTILTRAGRLSISNPDCEIAFYFRQLDWLHRNDLMSATQARRFARLVWAGVGPYDLPDIPQFYRGAALTWPCPSSRTSVNRTFRRWLNAEPIERIEQPFEHMGRTVKGFGSVSEALLVNSLLSVANNIRLEWTEQELLHLCKKISDWWDEEGKILVERAIAKNDDTIQNYLSTRLRLIAHVLHRVVAPRLKSIRVVESRLSTWLKELWDAGIVLDSPLVPLLFAGLEWWPEYSTTVVELTTSTLSSCNDADVTSVALSSAGVWLSNLRQPTVASEQYVNWLVESIRSPTSLCLSQKLESITDLLRFRCERHFEPFKATLCVALGNLLATLQDRPATLGVFAEAARPLLRVATVSALAAVRDTLSPAPSYSPWIGAMQMTEADNLLLVRRLIQK